MATPLERSESTTATATSIPASRSSFRSASGATPAIADIDLDGRNEIIVNGSFWNGFSGMYPKVWAYDLGGGTHGAVEWGQFMGGPRHQGRYGQPVD